MVDTHTLAVGSACLESALRPAAVLPAAVCTLRLEQGLPPVAGQCLGVAVVGVVELDIAIFYGALEVVGTGIASVDHLEVVLPFVDAGHGYSFSLSSGWDGIDGDCSWVC